MRTIRIITSAIFMLVAATSCAQDTKIWNNKQCAVVLTYDDAIDIDIDNVAPALDSLNLKGTFYLIGSSPVIEKRLPEWRKIAAKGHARTGQSRLVSSMRRQLAWAFVCKARS